MRTKATQLAMQSGIVHLHPYMSTHGTVSLAEWDFGGFPPWLLTVKPPLSLRSSDPNYLSLVSRLVEGA